MGARNEPAVGGAAGGERPRPSCSVLPRARGHCRPLRLSHARSQRRGSGTSPEGRGPRLLGPAASPSRGGSPPGCSSPLPGPSAGQRRPAEEEAVRRLLPLPAPARSRSPRRWAGALPGAPSAAMAPRRRRGLAAAGSLLPLLCALLRAAADTSPGRVGLRAGLGPARAALRGGEAAGAGAGTGVPGPGKPGAGLCVALARGRAGKRGGQRLPGSSAPGRCCLPGALGHPP